MKKTITLAGLLLLLIFNIRAQDIKIMSFNMQQPYGTNWESRVANAASIINTHQPDILGTQELHAYMRDQILSRVPGYSTYGISRECDGSGEASYILYKSSKYDIDYANSGTFWLKDDYWNCGRGYDPDYNRICTYVRFKDKASGKHFYVYNSHFPMVSYHNARVKSANLLSQRAINRAIKDPVIFTGDFNSTENEGNPIEYIKNGTSLKMRDTYRDIYPTGFVTTGFGTRLDFIFLENKGSNATLSTYVVNSPQASDHLPIVATVRIGGQVNIPVGQYIWLKGSNGRYASSENGLTSMNCNRNAPMDWEKFLVVDAGSGKVALRGSNGRYVSSENGLSGMNCNRPGIDGWEVFNWRVNANGTISLQGNNGRYVSSENGLSAMICNRQSIDTWEQFTWGTGAGGRQGGAAEALEDDEALTMLDLYPNPITNHQLNINWSLGDESKAQLRLHDLSGKTLFSMEINEKEEQIRIPDNIKQGAYILVLNTDKQKLTRKVVIK
ncbi:MAG: endonuclease/exonuclease/phosphatase family protein [Marinoscillum sp.]